MCLTVGFFQTRLIPPSQCTNISREMAADSASQATDLTSGSGSFGKSCLLCCTDLELDWPDLSRVNPADAGNHAFGDWKQAAESGCAFCNIVVGVIDDAWKQHECLVSRDMNVILSLNESTGRYLLAFDPVMIRLEEPHAQRWGRGTITVYLDGTPSVC